MEIKKVGNTYKKKNWLEQNETFSFTLIAIIFWAAVLAALFI